MLQLFKNHDLSFFPKLIFLALILAAASCNEEGEFVLIESPQIGVASLDVHVTGSLSGADRENIEVDIYRLLSDAEDQFNPLTLSATTDSEGRVYFIDIEADTRYWIRANANVSFKIKRTEILNEGSNYFNISLL